MAATHKTIDKKYFNKQIQCVEQDLYSGTVTDPDTTSSYSPYSDVNRFAAIQARKIY